MHSPKQASACTAPVWLATDEPVAPIAMLHAHHAYDAADTTGEGTPAALMKVQALSRTWLGADVRGSEPGHGFGLKKTTNT